MTEQNNLSDRELMKLLPFYVNLTLDQSEQTSVENYLERSEEARKEVVYLKQLRQSLKQQPQATSPGELGLKRLQRDIKSLKESGEDSETGSATEPSGDSTFNRSEQASDLASKAQESARPQTVAVWWRNLAVAACLTLVLLGGISLNDRYAGNDAMQLSGGGTDGTLQVTFKPQVKEETIRILLLEYDLTIKSGPSALGVYQLTFASGTSEKTLKVAAEELRRRSDVIDTAAAE